ncbi:MAG: hypothetical protein JWQ35_1240 [Bacteriovoracaceae bacterium]|nr:hypothetical protein [Bacteriovoracaceae bacterium]
MLLILKRSLLTIFVACLCFSPQLHAGSKDVRLLIACDQIIKRLKLDEENFRETKPYSYLVPEAVDIFKQQMHSELRGKMLLGRVLKTLENIQELPEDEARQKFILADYNVENKVMRAKMTTDSGKSRTLLSIFHQIIYASEDQLPRFGMYFLPTLMNDYKMRARMWSFDPSGGSRAWKIKAFKGEFQYLTALKAKEKNEGDLLRLTLHESSVDDEFLEIVYKQLLEMNNPFTSSDHKRSAYMAVLNELGAKREQLEKNMARVQYDQNVSKVLFIYIGATEDEYIGLRFWMNANGRL